jgi:hypothetical protein
MFDRRILRVGLGADSKQRSRHNQRGPHPWQLAHVELSQSSTAPKGELGNQAHECDELTEQATRILARNSCLLPQKAVNRHNARSLSADRDYHCTASTLAGHWLFPWLGALRISSAILVIGDGRSDLFRDQSNPRAFERIVRYQQIRVEICPPLSGGRAFPKAQFRRNLTKRFQQLPGESATRTGAARHRWGSTLASAQS